MKLKEENVPEAILSRENHKNAPWNSFRDRFFAVEPKQPERERNSYKGKYADPEVPELICAQKKNNNLHVSS